MKNAGLAFLTALLIPAAAAAADLKVKAPVAPPPPPPYNWNGFYIGGEFGWAHASGTVTDLFGLSADASRDGWLAGGVIGYNFETANSVVFGVEADFDWTTLSATGAGIFVPALAATLQASAKTDWVSSFTGRIGFAADKALFYVKGGGAWVGNSASITNLATGLSVSASNTNNGWLLGGGIEWGFSPNWSAKFEYDYIALRSWTWNGVLFPTDTFTASRNISELKLGLNYRFGGYSSPASVMTKY
jgi:outer membrane immunogenic protein